MRQLFIPKSRKREREGFGIGFGIYVVFMMYLHGFQFCLDIVGMCFGCVVWVVWRFLLDFSINACFSVVFGYQLKL